MRQQSQARNLMQPRHGGALGWPLKYLSCLRQPAVGCSARNRTTRLRLRIFSPALTPRRRSGDAHSPSSIKRRDFLSRRKSGSRRIYECVLRFGSREIENSLGRGSVVPHTFRGEVHEPLWIPLRPSIIWVDQAGSPRSANLNRASPQVRDSGTCQSEFGR
jgi:hypothetical protein